MTDLDRVCAIVARVGEMDTIAPDEDMYAAGVDSMGAVDIMLDLEVEFEVTIPDDQFIKARTPDALRQLIASLRVP